MTEINAIQLALQRMRFASTSRHHVASVSDSGRASVIHEIRVQIVRILQEGTAVRGVGVIFKKKSYSWLLQDVIYPTRG